MRPALNIDGHRRADGAPMPAASAPVAAVSGANWGVCQSIKSATHCLA
ncbi:hypothetical protein [Pseudomonas piscis]